MPTIYDLAELAGVSIKTVSRVLNNEPHVRPATRERVEAAARKLSYQPSQAARRLAGNRSFLIAHLYEASESAYIGGIQSGAIRRCRELGYHLVVESLEANSVDIPATVERIISVLAPDGIILTPPLSDNREVVDLARKRGVRLVQVGSMEHEHGLQVFIQERAAAQAITEHLIELGHERIGIVRGHPQHRGAALRFDGFLDALAAAGMEPQRHYVTQGYFDVQSGIEAGRAMLALQSPPSAIFAANDQMALGVMIAARDMSIEVPNALSVAGFDDTPMSRLIWPSLTTVRQPLLETGSLAVEILVRRTEVELLEELPFALQIRASTAPAS
ncbi:LacI family DNA-binding transcriptional regulator [Sphingomonas sp. AP4-R1]|uniref:LacI family DNA-binding transcriptional regulator n=1 Tax=Sphingomonas sp. AP4-R1 TaxID=2735134 RepID=UPI001493D22A|nr:LacI family DNA-binding transcriptional regulator [Sphingomonas sp. AP4-R1]QJU58312.1 LacI family DNA-binding transcriptional regulator [Sphingomonas sp. AP4-R1]